MDYDKIISAAIESKLGYEIVPIEHEWVAPGDMLMGQLVGIKSAPSKDSDRDYKWFTFQTNRGLVQATLGKRQENLITEEDLGLFFRITLTEKRKAVKGFMNIFSIVKINLTDSDVVMLERVDGQNKQGKPAIPDNNRSK